MDTSTTADRIGDINTISAFLAHSSAVPTSTSDSNTRNMTYALMGSAILHTAKTLFDHLSRIDTPSQSQFQPQSSSGTSTHPSPSPGLTLIICGGIGHSTILLYDAISSHPRYSSIASRTRGLPESRVLEELLYTFWPGLSSRIRNGEIRLLVEDKSTNCGENAFFCKRELDAHQVYPERIVIVQDPTMARRTLAGFEKAWAGSDSHGDGDGEGASHAREFIVWSTFTPVVQAIDSPGLVWQPIASKGEKGQGQGQEEEEEEEAETGLWEQGRFIGLLLGEIPRLRDDKDGYGPNGKGFIAHVDIPEEVEAAWGRLEGVLEKQR